MKSPYLLEILTWLDLVHNHGSRVQMPDKKRFSDIMSFDHKDACEIVTRMCGGFDGDEKKNEFCEDGVKIFNTILDGSKQRIATMCNEKEFMENRGKIKDVIVANQIKKNPYSSNIYLEAQGSSVKNTSWCCGFFGSKNSSNNGIGH